MTKNMILEAAQLAALAHKGQNRKFGHSNDPFIFHPMRVAGRIAIHPAANEEMVAAAYLHDVLEDTDVSEMDLSDVFPYPVVYLVAQLTNPSKQMAGVTRAEKKAADREHLKHVSVRAKMIKLVDRIDNVREVVTDPEAPPDFVKIYRAESLLLLEALKGTDAELEAELAKLLE